MILIRTLSVLLAIIIFHPSGQSCTIFSSKDSLGNVWVGNNEDLGYFHFGHLMKITPKTDSTFGFFYFRNANNILPQGGVNEMGLFFDFNAVSSIPGTNGINKTPYPGETGIDIMLHLLGRCKSVPEVIELFSKHSVSYFKKAQMHVADKFGNLGLILPDTAYITSRNFHVSTNFNLCAKKINTGGCWRYPIANDMLSSSEPGFELFTAICDSTGQRGRFNTFYSNIHNLSTGKMQIYHGLNYTDPYVTTLEELLNRGDTMILIRDLFQSNDLVEAYYAYLDKDFNAAMVVLNGIADSVTRQERIRLLAFDMIFGSTKDRLTSESIYQIIDASNDALILSFLAKNSDLRKNRAYAKKKLKTMGIANFEINPLNWIFAILVIVGLIMLITKKSKTTATNTA